ncbi:MAG: hypothetical protein WCI34_02405 [Actinomycetes bacterium]
MKNTRPNNKSLPAYYSRGLFALLGTLVITAALGMGMSASSAKASTGIPAHAAASARHCVMATPKTPQVCATASTGHHLSVVVSGKWAAKNPSAAITGYTFMGRSRTTLDFTADLPVPTKWTSAVTLPAGRIWTIKVTIPTATGTKTITLMTNIL